MVDMGCPAADLSVVRRHLGEDPSCLMTRPTPAKLQRIAISPDSQTVAASSEDQLFFFSMEDPSKIETVDATGDGM